LKHPILVALVVASNTSITATDLSGQWTLRLDPDFRGNPGVPADCTFKQRGDDLTVKCGTGGEMKGTVRGSKVTWGAEKTGIPPMTEDRLVLTFTADVNEAVTTLKGTWRLTSGVLDKKGDFEARRKR
jgi:hypothetical protein